MLPQDTLGNRLLLAIEKQIAVKLNRFGEIRLFQNLRGQLYFWPASAQPSVVTFFQALLL